MLGERFIFLLIAASAGVLMAVQGSANSLLGKVVGLLEATFIVHLTGLLFAAGLLLAGMGKGHLMDFTQAPWYTLIGGIIGIGITYGVIKSIPPVGVAAATTAIIVGQVFTATLIDHLGLFGMEKLPLTWSKYVGTGLLAAGTWFLLKR